MGLSQDYWSIASNRFGRTALTRDISQPYLSMTQPVYWPAVGMQVSVSSALAALGTRQDAGGELLALASGRYGRPMQTRDTSLPYLPMVQPLYFGQDFGRVASALASAVLAAVGAETTLGTLASVLSSAVLAGTGKEKDSGTLATTLANAILAGTGRETDHGTLATALASAVLAATGTETYVGTLATTLASAVLAGVGHERDSGVLATTLASAVLAGTGTEVYSGHLATTLASAVLAATGTDRDSGTLATTLASVVLAIAGSDNSGAFASVVSNSFAAHGNVASIPGASYSSETKSPTYFMEDGAPTSITGNISGFALNANGRIVSVDDTGQPRNYLWGIPIDSDKRVILSSRYTTILFKNGPTVCSFVRIN